MTTLKNVYLRFTVTQRAEHAIMLISFVVLALTGLPQKYAGNPTADAMIQLFGGIETTRVIHRMAAIVLMLEAVFHTVALSYRLYVKRAHPSMMPGLRDATDGWQTLLYNLGIFKSAPQMGRYTFTEKVEYWSLVWGTVIMIITGFMIWNPIATARFLPGQFIPAAKAAHGGEALLAVLAVVIWHIYHVHVRTFNRSMFSGVLTEEQMAHEHPLELAAIKGGNIRQPPDAATIRRRRLVFLPVALLLSGALLLGVYAFTTFEQTAITTLPPATTVEAFVPLTPTPIPATATPLPVAASALTWDGYVGPLLASKCVACHGVLGGLSLASYADLQKGSQSGPVVVPGDAANSLLVTKIEGGAHPGQLSDDELGKLKDWIDAGAPES